MKEIKKESKFQTCPLISVVMPVYNVSDYVIESVESIVNQTYPNLEIIIVDDASTDSTFEILKNKYGSNKKIKIFRNNYNKKISYSLNYGIDKAKGQYIARIDGDDIAMPNRIEKQYEYLISNPNISLVGCSLIGIDDDGNEFNKTLYPSSAYKLARLSYFSSPISHIWLCKKELYDKIGGYRFDGVEDYDFLLRMKTSGYLFDNIPNYYGMKIRHRFGNTRSTIGLKQRLAFNYVRNLYKCRVRKKEEYIYEIPYDEYTKKSFFFDVHSFSNKLLDSYLLDKKIIKIPYFIISVLISPYQFQYIYNRFVFKLMSKLL